MSQGEINKIKQEVKEKALAKMRKMWFREYKEMKNVKAVCRKYGIHRSYADEVIRLIKERRGRKKALRMYEIPKYLPGETIQRGFLEQSYSNRQWI